MATTRRYFLLSAAALPALARGPRRSPNDILLAGFIGLGNRAQWLLQNENFPNTRIVALADCYLPRCYEAAKLLPGGDSCNKYGDYRRLLEREKLDAVFVETTTHARALIAIHAMQAGVDVYAETPITLTVGEGRLLARAARRYGRVFQAGTQQRSMAINGWAARLVRDGRLGRVRTVTVCNFEGPSHYEWRQPELMPDGMDWEQWTNQAEMRRYNSELYRNWQAYRQYDGGGKAWGVTGWGSHALDIAQWALGADATGPVEMRRETPGPNGRVMLRYASGTVLELDGEPRRDSRADLGATLTGERGKLYVRRGVVTADPAQLAAEAPEAVAEGPGENRAHIGNFLDCVRTRALPNAPVETAHRSMTVCHLVNICREAGRTLRWDPQREEFIGDAEANRLLSRPRRKGYELPKL